MIVFALVDSPATRIWLFWNWALTCHFDLIHNDHGANQQFVSNDAILNCKVGEIDKFEFMQIYDKNSLVYSSIDDAALFQISTLDFRSKFLRPLCPNRNSPNRAQMHGNTVNSL